MGQSKGAEFAAALGCLRPDLVEVTLPNSWYFTNPSFGEFQHENRIFEATDMNFWIFGHPGFNFEKEVLEIPDQHRAMGWRNENFFDKNENNELCLNKDVFRNAVSNGFPLKNANKIIYHQTLADPLCSPTSESARA